MDGIATGFGCGYVFVLLFRPASLEAHPLPFLL